MTISIPTTPKSITISSATFHLIYADLLPPLSGDEYAILKSSIQQYGIRKDIHVNERADGSFDVIDGQHRLLIASELDLSLDRIPLKREDLDPDTQETLALSLNLARRHLNREQRQQYALKLRQKGQSWRQIGTVLGTSKATAQRDAASAAEGTGVQVETPETITGADGKQYPAVQEKTKVAQHGEMIMALFPNHTVRLSLDSLVKRTNLSYSQVIKTVNLLEASKRLQRHQGNSFSLPQPDAPARANGNGSVSTALNPQHTKAASEGTDERSAELPVVIVDGQPLSASDIPGYADLQKRAESTDTAPKAAPAPPSKSGPQRRIVTVETAREFVADQLRGSSRPLTAGEISKWANIDLAVTKEALAAMVEAGNLVAVNDARGGQAYHYTDIVHAEQATIITRRAVNLATDICDDTLVERLTSNDYSVLDTEQIAKVRAAISEAMSALGAMIEQLDALDNKLASQLVESN